MYVRDSGLLHALLAIPDKETLVAHPVLGQSWEGFVVASLLDSLPEGVHGYFYRSNGGAEIDLLLAWSDGSLWAIEIKRSLTPKVERGFHAACADLQPARKLLIYPGGESYRLAADIEVVGLVTAAALVAGYNGASGLPISPDP